MDFGSHSFRDENYESGSMIPRNLGSDWITLIYYAIVVCFICYLCACKDRERFGTVFTYIAYRSLGELPLHTAYLLTYYIVYLQLQSDEVTTHMSIVFTLLARVDDYIHSPHNVMCMV